VRQTGKVKWFNDEKGFGFVIPDDGSADIFAHRSNFKPPLSRLSPDQAVSYEVAESGKGSGLKAVAVQLVA
jgi:CspA family cold shock protein